jgi:Cyclic nucleotide-binding domain
MPCTRHRISPGCAEPIGRSEADAPRMRREHPCYRAAMTAGQRALALKTNRVFGDLPAQEIEWPAAPSREVEYRPRDYVFMEGEPAEWLCIVKLGRIRIVRHSKSGKDFVLELLGPGEIFGGVAVIGASGLLKLLVVRCRVVFTRRHPCELPSEGVSARHVGCRSPDNQGARPPARASAPRSRASASFWAWVFLFFAPRGRPLPAAGGRKLESPWALELLAKGPSVNL